MTQEQTNAWTLSKTHALKNLDAMLAGAPANARRDVVVAKFQAMPIEFFADINGKSDVFNALKKIGS